MIYGLLPATNPTTLRQDHVHRLAVQSLQQAKDDAQSVGDWRVPLKKRLLAMEEEARLSREKESIDSKKEKGEPPTLDARV